jgi:hypothetical protein
MQKIMGQCWIGIVAAALLAANAYAADTIRKLSTPADNDALIGQYMKTKNTQYIQTMLETYNTADDAALKDARRFANLSRDFKNPKSPRPNLQKDMATAICQKYECKTNPARANQFFTVASGLWALGSLSKQDPQINQTVTGFLHTHPRMKNIFLEEDAIASNYWTLTIASIAEPKKLDPVLARYEQLGPLDVNQAMQILGKPAKR